MGGEPFYHDAILQKLNAYLQNNGRQVFYSLESFLNTDVWENIPLIYKQAHPDGSINHPDHDAVNSGHLQDDERIVGKVEYAYIPTEGQPRLCAMLSITDTEVESLARAGKLGISTGFEAEPLPETEGLEGSVRIVGAVKPNHVLLFEQGACPNCWPNDGAAMFENTTKEQSEMTAPIDNESRGWIKAIHDKICNTKPEREPVAEQTKANNTMAEIDNLKTEITQLKNTLEQRDNRIKELEAANLQREKDAAWTAMKNTIPQGWLTAEKEKETRAMFENNKDAFYAKLMAHKEQFGNTQHAEGTKDCGCPKDAATQINNIREDVMNKCGFNIVGE